MNEKDFFEINRILWNQRAEIHVDTEFYDMKGFRAGNTSLKKIELDLLGDITDKDILHLQCHFGQDTLSLARMGANVTGLDLSEKAIETAQSISNELNITAEFICSNTLDADKNIDKKFDIIFTSYGAICWLPELNKWAKNISNLLKPNGKILVVEFHPAYTMFADDFSGVEYGYFNKGELVDEFEGTYADKNSTVQQKSVWWNHSIADVQTALLNYGFRITHFSEYDYSPYNIFEPAVKTENGWQVKGMEGKIPFVYAIEAIK